MICHNAVYEKHKTPEEWEAERWARAKAAAEVFERAKNDAPREVALKQIEKAKSGRRVRRLDTKEVFDTAMHAARSFGQRFSNQILRACKDGRTAYGIEWRFVDRFGNDIAPKIARTIFPKEKPIIVNGESFPSRVKAAKKFGVKRTAFAWWLKRGGCKKRGAIQIADASHSHSKKKVA